MFIDFREREVGRKGWREGRKGGREGRRERGGEREREKASIGCLQYLS